MREYLSVVKTESAYGAYGLFHALGAFEVLSAIKHERFRTDAAAGSEGASLSAISVRYEG